MTLKLSRDSSFLLGAVCVLVASIGAYWFVYSQITTMQETFGEVVDELESILAQEQAHGSLATFIEQTASDRAELERFMLSRDNPTPFLALVERLADETHVTVEVDTLVEEDATTSEDGNVGGAQQLRTTLSVEGALTNVNTLLELFESMPYIVLIDQAMLAESETDGLWSGQVHMRVVVR